MKLSKFKTKVIKGVDKTEKEVFTENLNEFVEKAEIEIETQILTREKNLIPLEEFKVKKLTGEKVKMEKLLLEIKYSLPHDREFSTWLRNVTSLEKKIESIDASISIVEDEINKFKAEVEKLKEYLNFITA